MLLKGSLKECPEPIRSIFFLHRQEDFATLDEYLAYEYTTRSRAPSGDYPTDKLIYHLEFPETLDLPEEDRYVLLYFQSTGTRGVTGLAGMSNVFKAEKRCPSPRLDSVD